MVSGLLFMVFFFGGRHEYVSGITFYEHGETAGLGGEVDNPDWKKSWEGKKIYSDGSVALRVVKARPRGFA